MRKVLLSAQSLSYCACLLAGLQALVQVPASADVCAATVSVSTEDGSRVSQN